MSLANIPSLLKLLTFSHRPAKFASMMKMLLKLLLNILFRPQKDSDLALENLALRQQLAIWKRQKKRPQIRTKDSLFWIMFCRLWSNWQESLIVVKPETVIRWHRKGFKLFWGFKFRKRDPGTLRSALRSVILFLKWQRPILSGVRPEFMASYSSWEPRSPSEQFPTC